MEISDEERQKLFDNNDAIIKRLLDKIKKEYPESVDLVGISGSFSVGQYHKKSDLDLLIIANKNIDGISKCFIFDSIGQDIYYRYWNDLEKMSDYNDIFVSKLKDLKIIYYRDDEVLKRYKQLQNKLDDNINNNEKNKITINRYLDNIIEKKNLIQNVNDLNECYKLVGSMMNDIENVIYINNKRYLYGGTKNILNEMCTMESVPNNFINEYKKILDIIEIGEIKEWAKSIVNMLLVYFNKSDNNNCSDNNIIEKKDITKEDLIGSYEELYSNFYNKMFYASISNNKYLSFRTMIDAQGFFDEFCDKYNINSFKLIEKYNPNNLESNAIEFDKLLKEWKKLYDFYDIRIEEYESLDELYSDELSKK